MVGHESFMKAALAEARKGMREGQKPFAGCLVMHNKIIALGHNTVYLEKDIAAHGEINTLRIACKKTKTLRLHNAFEGGTMYTTCEPCDMCLGACRWAGIKRIVYGISLKDLLDIEAGREISGRKRASNKKEGIEMVGGVLRSECADLFLGR